MLRHLTELSLQNNRLTAFLQNLAHHEICLINLQHLDLSSNRLQQVPKSITKLPSLQTLGLAYNFIEDISLLCSNSLLRLEVLDVSNNKITKVPTFINNLISLSSLNIQNNALKSIPYELGFMKELKNLKIEGNLLKRIRMSVIRKGSGAILKYLRDLAPVNRKKKILMQEEIKEDIQY